MCLNGLYTSAYETYRNVRYLFYIWNTLQMTCFKSYKKINCNFKFLKIYAGIYLKEWL